MCAAGWKSHQASRGSHVLQGAGLDLKLSTAGWAREALLNPLGKGHMGRDYPPWLHQAQGEGGIACLPWDDQLKDCQEGLPDHHQCKMINHSREEPQRDTSQDRHQVILIQPCSLPSTNRDCKDPGLVPCQGLGPSAVLMPGQRTALYLAELPGPLEALLSRSPPATSWVQSTIKRASRLQGLGVEGLSWQQGRGREGAHAGGDRARAR